MSDVTISKEDYRKLVKGQFRYTSVLTVMVKDGITFMRMVPNVIQSLVKIFPISIVTNVTSMRMIVAVTDSRWCINENCLGIA